MPRLTGAVALVETLQVDRVAGSYYEIAVTGQLGRALRHWFADLEITAAGSDGTLLYGWFEDQADLRALLNELGDLGVEIRSVQQVPDRR